MYEEDGGGGDTNHDSNQAAEDDAEPKKVSITKTSVLALPPRDGSIVFRGPTNQRQMAVVNAFKHAWSGYKTYAWGHDHLRPISKGAQNWYGKHS